MDVSIHKYELQVYNKGLIWDPKQAPSKGHISLSRQKKTLQLPIPKDVPGYVISV